MKNLYGVIFLIMFTLFASIPARGEQDQCEVNVIIEDTVPSILPPRQRMPYQQKIFCHCVNDLLRLQLAASEGLCILKLTNTNNGTMLIYEFDSSYPVQIYVGQISKVYIQLATSHGHMYTGYIYK